MRKFRRYFWSTGEPWNSVRSWFLPQLLRVLHSFLMCTLRVSLSGAGRLAHDEVRETGVLYVTWHDLTFMPLHLFRHRNLGVMMSTSHSGQIQAAFWRMYGWPTVWGSTKKREGIRAMREVLRLLRTGQSFAFSPDGPKGPRHQAHAGAIYLAANAPTVIVAMGVAASEYWQLPSWDRYMIPKPFSRVHVHLSEDLVIPPNLPREENQFWQDKLGELINEANAESQRQLEKR